MLTAEQITDVVPGVYHDLSNEAYHAGPGLSSSGVKKILECPAKFKYQQDNPGSNNPTAQMMLGTLVHSLVLEPDQALQDHIVVEASTRNTNIYKEAVAKAGSRSVYLDHEFETAKAIADSVLADDRCRLILEGSINESSIYWDQDGVLSKCRPDIWRPDIRVAADLKTASDGSPKAFQRQCINLGYHVSAAWYLTGIKSVKDRPPVKDWAWIVVETVEPYVVQVYAADPALIEKGHQMWQQALETLKRCQETGKWPAYSEAILPIELPSWAA